MLLPALENNNNAWRVNGCAAEMCYLLSSKLSSGGREQQEQVPAPVAKLAWYFQ